MTILSAVPECETEVTEQSGGLPFCGMPDEELAEHGRLNRLVAHWLAGQEDDVAASLGRQLGTAPALYVVVLADARTVNGLKVSCVQFFASLPDVEVLDRLDQGLRLLRASAAVPEPAAEAGDEWDY